MCSCQCVHVHVRVREQSVFFFTWFQESESCHTGQHASSPTEPSCLTLNTFGEGEGLGERCTKMYY